MEELKIISGKIIPKGEYLVKDTINLSAGDYVFFEPSSKILFEFSEKKSGFIFADNVTFDASGSVFEMKYTGDLTQLNVDDTGPHLLSLLGVKNCKIIGGSYNMAAGDSVYIGTKFENGLRVPCEDIKLDFITCIGSRRQGISITNAKNVHVRGCHFENIKGASPQSAIDIEPNHPSEFAENIVIEACRAVDCGSHAFVVNVARFITTNTVSIDFKDIAIYNMGARNTIRVVGMGVEDTTRPKGYVRVTNASMLWDNG